MENKIKELEKRIEELENFIKNVSFADATTVTFTNGAFGDISIGDGANITVDGAMNNLNIGAGAEIDISGSATGNIRVGNGSEVSLNGCATGAVIDCTEQVSEELQDKTAEMMSRIANIDR